MATRYWVGGAGTWDATTTTNWSATSGGAGGASAPTSADNAIFNTLSNATAYAVTVGTNAVAADVTIAGPASGNVTITGTATSVLNCYGSWANAATGVAFSNSAGGAQVFFLATVTGKTVTTNSVSFNNWALVFNSLSGGWTLGSAHSSNSGINVILGNFSTGNFNTTMVNFVSTGSGTRTVSLGSSTLTLNGAAPWTTTTTTNLTFNAGTSTIVCSNASPIFAGGGLTYNNVQFTSTGSNHTNITGVNTFNNLSQTSPIAGRRNFGLSNNQTVTGTLTLGASNTYNARIQVVSNAPGIAFTITAATVAALSDVDFRDITAAGASAPWSGTRLGNGLGNTNITFAAGKTVYWNLVAGGNWSANAWATSSGGAVATANFPLAQDTAIIDNTGLTTGNTITVESFWWLGTLNATRTNSWNYVSNVGLTVYGDFTFSSATTVSGTSVLIFQGQGLTQTFTTNGVSLSNAFTVQAVNGTLLLNGAVTCASTETVTLNNGTLNLNNYTLTTGYFSSSNSNARTLAFGTGKIKVTALNTSVWGVDVATNLTLTGTPRVEVSGAGTSGQTRGIFNGFTNGTEANSANFYVTAGVDTVQFYGTARKYGTIDFTGFAGYWGSDNWIITIYGNLVLNTNILGLTTTSTFSGPITFASTSATARTITTAGKTYPVALTFDGVGGTWACQDALNADGNAITLTNGTLNANNQNVSMGTFSSSNANVRTLALGTGTWTVSGAWNCATSTNLTVTGTGTINMTNATSKTFSGGGKSWPTLNQGGAGTLTITGANSFQSITNTVQSSTVVFPASTSTNVNIFKLNGIAGSLTTINSSVSGTKFTLVNNGPYETNCNYLNIKDSSATGNKWYAGNNSVNSGNNTGWIFSASSIPSNFLSFF